MHIFELLFSVLPFSYSGNLFTQFFISYINWNQKDQGKFAVQEQKCVPLSLLRKRANTHIADVKQEDSFLSLFSKSEGEIFPSVVFKEGSTQPCTTGFQGYDCTWKSNLWASALPRNKTQGTSYPQRTSRNGAAGSPPQTQNRGQFPIQKLTDVSEIYRGKNHSPLISPLLREYQIYG